MGYARYLEEEIRVPEKTTSNIFVALESSDEEQQWYSGCPSPYRRAGVEECIL